MPDLTPGALRHRLGPARWPSNTPPSPTPGDLHEGSRAPQHGAPALGPGCAAGLAAPTPWRFRAMLHPWTRTTSIAALPLTRRRSEEHTSELQSRGHLVCRL